MLKRNCYSIWCAKKILNWTNNVKCQTYLKSKIVFVYFIEDIVCMVTIIINCTDLHAKCISHHIFRQLNAVIFTHCSFLKVNENIIIHVW